MRKSSCHERRSLRFCLVCCSWILLACVCCRHPLHTYPAFDHRFLYSGRIDTCGADGISLITSAASVSMEIDGESCIVFLRNEVPNGRHNYFGVEINGRYQGRYRIDGNDIAEMQLKLPAEASRHRITITKETEPGVGNISFCGIRCESLLEMPETDRPRIEFIGNSITCAMSAYPDEIPCDEGEWYDQHNAYCSYASRLARALNAQYMLSAVSGCGIYRHWSRDHPTLPEIYDQTYLDDDTTQRWDFTSWIPDIVSICLGTNDLSDGDGVTPRAPFDPDRFTTEYVGFVEKIYRRYPDAQIILLSSPMLAGDKAAQLASCLELVKAHVDSALQTRQIRLYHFDEFRPNGCGYHPDCADHEKMARELIPVFQELLAETD